MLPYDPTRKSLLDPASTPTLLRPDTLATQHRDAIVIECARLAYFRFEKDPVQRQAWLDALALLGAVDLKWYSVDSTQAFAFVLPAWNQAIVSFRGTEPDSLGDLATDIDALPIEWIAQAGAPTVSVHSGFAKALDDLIAHSDLVAWLDRNQRLDKVFTGHSLGAALATLAAARWGAKRLVTVGSPRVGDAGFASLVAAVEVRRYVNCCDVVTTLPPPLGRFVHVGDEIYIDSSGRVVSDDPGFDRTADRSSARIAYLKHEAWRTSTVLLRDLADHAPVNYLRTLF